MEFSNNIRKLSGGLLVVMFSHVFFFFFQLQDLEFDIPYINQVNKD